MSDESRIIELSEPHFENAALTHVEVVSLHPRNILLRWHDGTESKGSLVSIPHNREPDEETGEVDMEFTDEELAALVDAYLTEQANKPAPERPLDSRMYQEFLALPLEVQVAFAPAWTIVNEAVHLGHFALARATIEAAEVPEELEPVRTKLLGMLPQ